MASERAGSRNIALRSAIRRAAQCAQAAEAKHARVAGCSEVVMRTSPAQSLERRLRSVATAASKAVS
jgi:hypothetical protein